MLLKSNLSFKIRVIYKSFNIFMTVYNFIDEGAQIMAKKFETHFFLGANSPTGFYSLYNNFTDPENDRLYIIKSGPGSGKSTFMRIIADAVLEHGLSVEYIHCSGDPDSLDGVLFPDLHIAYVDGTSPHVIEPTYAGSGELYVNLSQFYSDDIREKHTDIMRLTKAYKSYYSRAYKLIGSAKSALDATLPELPEEAVNTVMRRSNGIILREIHRSGKDKAHVVKRFLSAVTCKGFVTLYNSIEALAERVYLLDNDLGFAPLIIEKIADAAEESGWDTIRCVSPMDSAVTEHLIIPELSLAFVSQTSKVPYSGPVFRHLRLDSIPDKTVSASLRSAKRASNRLYDTLIAEAIEALQNAKQLHDRLESTYNPYVNFDGVRSLAEKHIEKIFN